jgi:hypothetical protein
MDLVSRHITHLHCDGALSHCINILWSWTDWLGGDMEFKSV